MEGEQPILSGGKQITNWKIEPTGLFSAQLDTNSPGNIRELFINNKRVIRSMHPNQEYLQVSKAGEDGRTNFQFEPNDIFKVKTPNELDLIFLYDWSISKINVKSIDWNENKLTTVDWVGAKVLDFFHMTNWEKQPRYFLENAMEFVDSPSEWFYDLDDKKIYYYPKKGETTSNIEAVIPSTSQLIKITGNRQNREKVKNISFEGITFEYSNWQIPNNGYCGIQACMFDNRSEQQDGWNKIPAAIEVDLASNCFFNNCIIRHTGGSGIWFREETENCIIRNSHLYDISGNGINIGEGKDRLVQNDP